MMKSGRKICSELLNTNISLQAQDIDKSEFRRVQKGVCQRCTT